MEWRSGPSHWTVGLSDTPSGVAGDGTGEGEGAGEDDGAGEEGRVMVQARARV